jgi:hypothetical protein
MPVIAEMPLPRAQSAIHASPRRVVFPQLSPQKAKIAPVTPSDQAKRCNQSPSKSLQYRGPAIQEQGGYKLQMKRTRKSLLSPLRSLGQQSQVNDAVDLDARTLFSNEASPKHI